MAKKASAQEGPAPEEGTGLVSQLQEAIRRSGESLSQLAVTCGVDSGRLSRFMRGERDLTLRAAERVCEALHLRLTSINPPPEAPTLLTPDQTEASVPPAPPTGKAKGKGKKPKGE
jgi:transcriptional regulator with XRE-family HTH domain